MRGANLFIVEKFNQFGRVGSNLLRESVVFPLLYVTFVYIRAAILNFNPEVPYIYPYFFLNLETQGVAGVLRWVVILFLGFIALGYFFYGIDKAIKSSK